jgi:serine/threonine-protein phosphatase 6 regulatory subunit 3
MYINLRYPFLISEILGSENEKLINFFFEKPEQASQEDI